MNKMELIKELRFKTNAGIFDVKKALEDSNWDVEKATILLKEIATKKATKKSNNVTAEGVVNIVENDQKIIIYEINSQTDFVAQNEHFKDLVSKIGNILLNTDFNNIEEALTPEIKTILTNAIGSIGENLVLRNVKIINKANSTIGWYVHSNKRIASIVKLEGGNFEIAKNIAMHVASMNPPFLNESSIPNNKMMEIEQEISNLEVLKNKPENIKNNILKGMLNKKLAELTLLNQEFVMEKGTVSEYASRNNAKIIEFARLEVGQGVKKSNINFVDEVKSQMS